MTDVNIEAERIVGPDVPPTSDGTRWERGKSPWHAEAFPGEFRDIAPEQGVRRDGWLELDWCGNVIGWVPDGASVRKNVPKRAPEARKEDTSADPT